MEKSEVAKETEKVVITLRAPDDIDKMLSKAEKATGSSRTELIIEAIRESLWPVVERIDRERTAAAKEFFNEKPTTNLGLSAPRKSLAKTGASKGLSETPKR